MAIGLVFALGSDIRGAFLPSAHNWPEEGFLVICDRQEE